MGMFDYIVGLKVKCPVCGKNRDRKWQTKAFLNQLDTYKVGDSVNIFADAVWCIGVCPICKTRHEVKIYIKNKILTNDYTNLNKV